MITRASDPEHCENALKSETPYRSFRLRDTHAANRHSFRRIYVLPVDTGEYSKTVQLLGQVRHVLGRGGGGLVFGEPFRPRSEPALPVPQVW